MSQYQIETTAPSGQSITVPIPDGFVDQVRREERKKVVEEIRAGIEKVQGADWGKSRGKIAYIQGMGQARRIAEGKPCSPTP